MKDVNDISSSNPSLPTILSVSGPDINSNQLESGSCSTFNITLAVFDYLSPFYRPRIVPLEGKNVKIRVYRQFTGFRKV